MIDLQARKKSAEEYLGSHKEAKREQ